MKIINLLSATFLFVSLTASATIDVNHSVYVLSQDVQSGEYFVQKAPIIACYGIEKGPELQALTKEYIVPSNVGCGSISKENINALSCAKVVSSSESYDFSTFKNIELDISKCLDKNNTDFIKSIKKVIKLNFNTFSVKKINLKLIK